MTGPSNFAFLVEHSTLLADLGATAERLYSFDPSRCVLKLRLLAEAITRDIAALVGVALGQPNPGRPSSCSSAWPPAATPRPRPSEAQRHRWNTPHHQSQASRCRCPRFPGTLSAISLEWVSAFIGMRRQGQRMTFKGGKK